MHRRSIPIVLVLCGAVAPAAAQWGPIPATTPPSARSGALAGFDVINNRVLLFGGNFGNELWSFANGAWAQLTPATLPPARARAAMATNPLTGEILLYGGTGGGGGSTALDDTWTWNGSDWQQQSPGTTPLGRDKHMLVFDVGRQVYVLYGGRQGLFQPNQALAETWEYSIGIWYQVVPVQSPPGLTDAAMAYLAQQGVTVLFGGNDNTGTASDQTWIYDGIAQTWTQVATTGPRPSARFGARMEANLNRGVLVLTGGRDSTTLAIQNDTWEFDGTTWREVTGVYGGMYPPRYDFAMAHDYVRDRIVVFGGDGATGFPFDETLEFGAHFQPFGLACAGSAGTPQLVPGTLPRIGDTCTVDVTNLVPTVPVAAMAVGLSRQQWAGGSLPTLLTGLGLTGCRAYTSAELIVALPASNGTATWSFTFPNDPTSLGDTYFLQALSLDPNWNPAWLVTSNAATLVVGF